MSDRVAMIEQRLRSGSATPCPSTLSRSLTRAIYTSVTQALPREAVISRWP